MSLFHARMASIIKSASVGNLVRILGIPQEIAEELNKRLPTIDFQAGVLWKLHMRNAQPDRGYAIDDPWWNLNYMIRIEAPLLLDHPKIAKWLSSNWVEVLKTYNDVYSLMDAMWQMVYDEQAEELARTGPVLKDRAILTFPDGLYWVPIRGEECELEGKMMQHCGDGTGQMYSLRDARNMPHVTATVVGNVLTEVRGKQNAIPAPKYIGHVKALLKHLGVNSSTMGPPGDQQNPFDLPEADQINCPTCGKTYPGDQQLELKWHMQDWHPGEY